MANGLNMDLTGTKCHRAGALRRTGPAARGLDEIGLDQMGFDEWVDA
jgi:hypothetical protein